MRRASDVIAALRAGPAPDELAGEAIAMAEFGYRVSSPVHARRSRRLPSLASRTWTGRAAATAAVAAIAVSGVATVAYAGALPAPVQRLAHELIGAPAAHAGGRHHHAALHSAPVRRAAHQVRLGCPWYSSAMRDGGRHDIAPSCRDSRRQPARHWRSPGCRSGPQQSWWPGPRRSRPQHARQAHPMWCDPTPVPAHTPAPRRVLAVPDTTGTRAPGQARQDNQAEPPPRRSERSATYGRCGRGGRAL